MSTVIAKNVQVGTSTTATDNFTIFQPATPDGTLRIGNGNTGVTTGLVTLTASGQLGLGTTTPRVISGYNVMTLDGSTGSFTEYRQAGGNTMRIGADSNLGFIYTQQANPIRFGTGDVERMRLTAGGSLGVGTTSPTINSSGNTIHLNTSAAGHWSLFHATTAESGAGGGDGSIYGQIGLDAYAFNYESGNLIFGTSNGERARITSTGNFLINTTTAIERLTVGGWISVNGQSGISGSASTIVTNCNGGGWYGIMVQNLSVTQSNVLTCINASGAVIGSILVSNTGTAFNTTSDYRLKNTVTPMTGALARVAALKPCTYKWNADGSDGEGFIAHELQEVCPQAVSGEKDAVNADGSIKPQGIDTSFLVATLTAAIQELKAEFDAYKASHP